MKLHEIYETKKLYRFNPCDLDCSYSPLKALAQCFLAVHKITHTECRCCTGARISALLALTFTIGYCLK